MILYIYVKDAQEVAYPYTVKINYIDSAAGAVIGNQYEAITADEGVTVLANDTTGDVVTIDDEGTPLADNPDTNAEDNGDTVTIDDETTPLAALPDNTNESGSSVNLPLVIGGAAMAAIVIIAAAGVVISRKRKNTK